MNARGGRKSVVKIGNLYVRDYPARFGGDFTLTPDRKRAATFHVEDMPKHVAMQISTALGLRGVKAKVLDARIEGGDR